MAKSQDSTPRLACQDSDTIGVQAGHEPPPAPLAAEPPPARPAAFVPPASSARLHSPPCSRFEHGDRDITQSDGGKS